MYNLSFLSLKTKSKGNHNNFILNPIGLDFVDVEKSLLDYNHHHYKPCCKCCNNCIEKLQ